MRKFLLMSVIIFLPLAYANVDDKNVKIDVSDKQGIENVKDINQCITFSYRKIEYVGRVVDFFNSCGKTITVYYKYYNGTKWITTAAIVSANQPNKGNPAGIREIKIIDMESK